MRPDSRTPDQLRPVTIQRGFVSSAAGSVLIRTGGTAVICTASIVSGVPEWREGSGAGWLTAEYDMLPASTGRRRSRSRERVDGRTREIERLIGRSLRAAVNMPRMGANTIHIDCDVLEADGGTRTASITGAYVALVDALASGAKQDLWGDDVRICAVAAVSVGVVDGDVLVDLNYREDVRADVDCNLVMTDADQWIEVQATGERSTFSQEQMGAMTSRGAAAIRQLFDVQRATLRG
ncbi:MAG: ribonuclease PH [Phycisphaerales bacterium]|nr:ribonuclease PH [Phycisphaerales bacterium]